MASPLRFQRRRVAFKESSASLMVAWLATMTRSTLCRVSVIDSCSCRSALRIGTPVFVQRQPRVLRPRRRSAISRLDPGQPLEFDADGGMSLRIGALVVLA